MDSAADGLGGTADERLLDRAADVKVDAVALQSLVDLGGRKFLVAAELDRPDARPLFDDGPDDDTRGPLLRLDADIVEETRLPEVEEVALQCLRVVGLAWDDAEVDADRVAGNGDVADGFEALHLLSGGRIDDLGGRGFGDPSRRRPVDDDSGAGARLRLRRRRLSAGGCREEKGRHRDGD
jgi:hypothetical protein